MEQNHSLDFHNGSSWFSSCTLDLDYNVRRVFLFLLYLFIFMAGLLENLLVLWVNWRRRHSANGVLFCILNMSFSDLMMVLTLPFYMMEVTIDHVWLWGSFLCRVTHLVLAVNFYSSSFFLALMTLERYLSLTKPAFPALFPVVGRRRWLLCGGVWLFSFFLALLENVHVNLMDWEEPGCHMWPESGFIEWFISIAFVNFIFQFLIPCTVIVTCNVLIAKAIQAAPDVQDPRDVRLVHVYSAVFVLCWFPYHLVMVVINVDYSIYEMIFSCDFADVLYFSYEIVEVLSLFHCVANPILYNFLSKSFRNKLMNTVLTYINKEGIGEVGTRTNGRGDVESGKQRKISNASTSQSDMGS